MQSVQSVPLRHNTYQFEAIGTRWAIDYTIRHVSTQVVESEVRALIAKFDHVYSRFRSDSLVAAMSRSSGTYNLPYNGALLLDLYDQLYDISGGKMTPLIGQVLVDLGYDANYSLVPGQPERPPAWDTIQRRTSSALTLVQPALLDFGAAGKGFLVDMVSELLQDLGATTYCVDAGGDIRHHSASNECLRVGLENPDNFEEAVGIATIGNQSICASSGSHRKWSTYHHIIDPDTLVSPQEVKATWVIADQTMLADGIATCLFFVEPERLRNAFAFEYIVVYADNTFRMSSGSPAELFIRTAVHP